MDFFEVFVYVHEDKKLAFFCPLKPNGGEGSKGLSVSFLWMAPLGKASIKKLRKRGGGGSTPLATEIGVFFIEEKKMQNVLKRKNMYFEGYFKLF